MSRHSKYPTDLDGLALLWRHRTAMHVLREHGRVDPDEALALLTIVIAPRDDQLEASRAAVRDKAVA